MIHVLIQYLAGCTFNDAPKNYSGTTGSMICEGNVGCSITEISATSFGSTFNAKGGGLYAMSWTSFGIQIWFWNEGNIPNNVMSNTPDTTQWGLPFASWQFGTWCPSSTFIQHKLVFDLTFCGDWAGNVFSMQCPNHGICDDFVRDNPEEFSQAYWNIHWMKVFQ